MAKKAAKKKAPAAPKKAAATKKKTISKTGMPFAPVHFTMADSAAMQTIAATRSMMPRPLRWPVRGAVMFDAVTATV